MVTWQIVIQVPTIMKEIKPFDLIRLTQVFFFFFFFFFFFL